MNICIISPRTVFLYGLIFFLKHHERFNVPIVLEKSEDIVHYSKGYYINLVLVDETLLQPKNINKTLANIASDIPHAKVVGMLHNYTEYKIINLEKYGIRRFINYSMDNNQIVKQLSDLDFMAEQMYLNKAKTWNNVCVDLTDMELKVLEQICYKKRSDEICISLGITIGALNNCIRRIKRKMHYNNIERIIIESIIKGFPTEEACVS